MKTISELVRHKPWLGWVLFLATLLLVFLVGLFGSSIIERRQEAALRFQLLKPIAEWEPRNEKWGENFPREYETYRQTLDTTFKSKYGGSVMRDLLKESPYTVILWAGYSFSRDYNQARGHYYAIKDIRSTLRTAVPQPATCWSCKSTDVPRLMNGMGVAEFYRKPWDSLGSEITNNIGCQDCHDPKTLDLRITRPALIEAFQRQGNDIRQATHQEMRSLVCAQCHVEYYFKGKKENYLTFPWDNGFTVEAMEAYYDHYQHYDFIHQLSRTPILKAQHPDYEVYRTGIHAERGVSCSDCHMPYRSEGGVKFTDHKIQSPLNNIANSCQVCHRESEKTLMQNVNDRQDKIQELKHQAEEILAISHIEAKFAWDNGATEEQMQPVLSLIRKAQWRWDWVAAANAVGFHSPLEAARVLGASINLAQQARMEIVRILATHGITTSVPLPDISSKEKAQQYIGLPMENLRKEKQDFLKNVVPLWDEAARLRQAKLPD